MVKGLHAEAVDSGEDKGNAQVSGEPYAGAGVGAGIDGNYKVITLFSPW